MNRTFQSEFLTYVESSSVPGESETEGGHVKQTQLPQETTDLNVREKEIEAERPQKEKPSSSGQPVSTGSTSPYGTRRQKSGIVKTKNYCVLLGKIQDRFPVVKGPKKSFVGLKSKKSPPANPKPAVSKPRDKSPKSKPVTSTSPHKRTSTKSTSSKMGTPDAASEKSGLPSDSNMGGHRPKRNIIPKNLEDTCGLSWREEKELKKALSASLKQTKIQDCLPSFTTDPQMMKHKRSLLAKPHAHKLSTPLNQQELIERLKRKKLQGRRDVLKLVMPDGKSSESNKSASNCTTPSSKCHLGLKHVRAQRKFAQGSRPDSPSTTPVKFKSVTTPKKVLANKRAKTEDFLTFLCLRGSSSLPPHLEYFNYSESESLQSFPNTPRHSQDGSRPSTPAQASAAETAATPTARAETQSFTARALSPDREILLQNDDLGVSPLVATANNTVGVVVGNNSSTLPVSLNQNSDTTNQLAVTRTTTSKTTSHSPHSTTTTSSLDHQRSPSGPLSSSVQQQPPAAERQVTVSMTSMTYTSAVGDKCSAAAGKPCPMVCRQEARMVQMCEGMQTVQHYHQQNVASGLVLPGGTSASGEKVEAATQTGESSTNSERDDDPTSSDSSLPVLRPRRSVAKLNITSSSSSDDDGKVAIMQPSAAPAVSPLCQGVVNSDQIISFTNLTSNPPQFVSPPQFMTTFLPSAVTLPTVTLPTVTMDPVTLQSLNTGLMLNTMSTCIQNTAVIQQPTHGLYGHNPPGITHHNPAALTHHLPGAYGTSPSHSLRATGPSHSIGTPGLTHSLGASHSLGSPGPCHNLGATVPSHNLAASHSIGAPSPGHSHSLGAVSHSIVAPGPALSYPPVVENTPHSSQPADYSPSTSPIKGGQSIIDTPKKAKSFKLKIKDSTKSVFGSKFAKKSKACGASTMTIAKQLGLSKSNTGSVLTSTAAAQRTNPSVLLKKSLKGIRAGKVTKKALQKQQGKKLVKKAKQAARGRPSTRALTAHIESQKLELAKAGAEDYELLTSDDVIILSSSPETTTPPIKSEGSATKRLSVSDREEKPPSKKPKNVSGKDSDSTASASRASTPSSVDSRKTRGKTPQTTGRVRTPSVAQEESVQSSKVSTGKKGATSGLETMSGANKPKAVKQLIKHPGPGRPPKSAGKESPSSSKVKSPGFTKLKTHIPKVSYRSSFPQADEPARVVDIPTYHPSPEQFEDPINYISSIRADAESYGMCCIVPPEGWKPECKMSEELRFTTQVQYVHRLQNRWGPSVLQMECIKKHLESQGITMEQPPLVGGNELDMPSLSQAIRSCGGLQTVIDEERWKEVTQRLKIPKMFHERTQRVCEIYCKYLLSYDTLSEEERSDLEKQAAQEQQKNTVSYQDCMARGRSRTLGEFFRASRNLTETWYDEDEPRPESVEEDYWRIVREGEQHVTSQIVHIDTKNCGSAFPTKKESPYSKHGWNFNMLQHNRDSVLRYIGQVSGVTVPMLHIGMLFSTCCWSREPHFLPYISYLHTGSDQIWYCIPKSEEAKFKATLEELVPDLVDPDSPIWLPEDAIMVSPDILTERGVSLCRHVQQQGQFIVVFPEAFTATISCGYNITESINFATPNWIPLGCKASQILYESCEPDLFSIERLIFAIARDAKVPTELHRIILPHLETLVLKEIELRKKVAGSGLKRCERLAVNDLPSDTHGKRRHTHDISPDEENRCDESKKMCYLSAIVNENQEIVYCLEHGLKHIQRKSNRKSCLLLYRFEEDELLDILSNVRNNVSSATRLSRRKGLKSP